MAEEQGEDQAWAEDELVFETLAEALAEAEEELAKETSVEALVEEDAVVGDAEALATAEDEVPVEDRTPVGPAPSARAQEPAPSSSPDKPEELVPGQPLPAGPVEHPCRLAHRGLSDVLIHDEQGRIWAGAQVGAGDRLSEHLLWSARCLRRELGQAQSVVLGFDRGGFCLEVLDTLDQEKFFYVAWVPATVKLPDLSAIAPPEAGVGEQRFEHSDLRDEHQARLLVRRDGDALVPALTNLPKTVSATAALEMLRRVRGMQENDIKAARSFAQIDHLVDRGGARRGPDDRLVDNPAYRELSAKRGKVRRRLEELSHSEPISSKDRARLGGEQLVAEFEEAVLNHKLSELSAKVSRVELEPKAKRAWLKTKNRSLLQPLKSVLANGRRWLLSVLGSSLAPSDAKWDQSAIARTLEPLIRAPGTVRFGRDEVVVTLELPLPPQPHARLAEGLVHLDAYGLRFTDVRRQVFFRLAPRPIRQTLPSARPRR